MGFAPSILPGRNHSIFSTAGCGSPESFEMRGPELKPFSANRVSGALEIATRATIYRSLWALRARNPKKVSRRVFLGVCRKVPENTRKSRKIPEKVQIWVFFGYFSTFSGIFGDFFADPQKDSFRDFFGISGPEGPETPVNGRSGRNTRDCESQVSGDSRESQECAEYGGTRCTGPTWAKLVPRRPTWTNLAKLVIILLCFACLEKHLCDQFGPSWSSTLSHSIPCTPENRSNVMTLSVTLEGGATKGGVSKCEQTQTNADKRKQTQRRKRKQTRANVSKRGQTQTNAYTPLYCGFLHPPP